MVFQIAELNLKLHFSVDLYRGLKRIKQLIHCALIPGLSESVHGAQSINLIQTEIGFIIVHDLIELVILQRFRHGVYNLE